MGHGGVGLAAVVIRGRPKGLAPKHRAAAVEPQPVAVAVVVEL